jgi:hypothetical protein
MPNYLLCVDNNTIGYKEPLRFAQQLPHCRRLRQSSLENASSFPHDSLHVDQMVNLLLQLDGCIVICASIIVDSSFCIKCNTEDCV